MDHSRSLNSMRAQSESQEVLARSKQVDFNACVDLTCLETFGEKSSVLNVKKELELTLDDRFLPSPHRIILIKRH